MYINPGTGNTQKSDKHFVSDYIPVSENVNYTAWSFNPPESNTGVSLIWYNSEKAILSNTNIYPKNTSAKYHTKTSPEGSCFCRLGGIIEYHSAQLMLVEGTEIPTEYEAYFEPYTKRSIKLEELPEKELNDGEVTPIKTSFVSVKQSKNLLGTNFGKYMVRTDNGNLYASESCSATIDHIPVEEGKIYCFSKYGSNINLGNLAEYDDKKNFVSASVITDTSYYTCKSGVAFIRISKGNYEDLADGYQLEEVKSTDILPTQFVKGGMLNQIKDDIKYRLVDLSKYKWDCIGDSFTDNSPRYHSYISGRTGIIVQNDGLSGSCIANYSTTRSTQSFLDRLNNIDYSSNVISIFGGINDARWLYARYKSSGEDGMLSALGTIDDRPTDADSAVTFYGAYRFLIEHIKNNAPKSRLFAIIPPKLHSAIGGDYEGSDMYIPLVRTGIKALCEEYGIPVVDLYSESGIGKMDIDVATWYISSTNIHLNNEGQRKISRQIENMLLSLFDVKEKICN